jgi:hypothetical protein
MGKNKIAYQSISDISVNRKTSNKDENKNTWFDYPSYEEVSKDGAINLQQYLILRPTPSGHARDLHPYVLTVPIVIGTCLKVSHHTTLLVSYNTLHEISAPFTPDAM